VRWATRIEEGVVDGERRHDEGDPREQDQGLLEGLMVLPLGLLFHLASQLGTGQRTSSAWLTPGSAATTMLVALPGPGRSTSSANSAVKPA
jgi:hypothetical protein